jgi:mRNA interferase MazF
VSSPEPTQPAAPALRRGQLYWIVWEPGRGSEQRGRRPGLIVQVDSYNRSRRYPNTIVAAVSGTLRDVTVHVTVEPSETNGLAQRSQVMCEQLLTISRERLDTFIGELDADDMARVNRALKRILALS